MKDWTARKNSQLRKKKDSRGLKKAGKGFTGFVALKRRKRKRWKCIYRCIYRLGKESENQRNWSEPLQQLLRSAMAVWVRCISWERCDAWHTARWDWTVGTWLVREVWISLLLFGRGAKIRMFIYLLCEWLKVQKSGGFCCVLWLLCDGIEKEGIFQVLFIHLYFG